MGMALCSDNFQKVIRTFERIWQQFDSSLFKKSRFGSFCKKAREKATHLSVSMCALLHAY